MFSKNKKKIVNYLDLTPERKNEHFQNDSGDLFIIIPRFYNKILLRLIVPLLKKPNVHYRLDEIGKVCWLKIDGAKTVGEICDEVSAIFGEKVEPVHDRVTAFYSSLYRMDLITFKELKKEKRN